MSDPAELRQPATDAALIANGDAMDALHRVDRIDAGLSELTYNKAVEALRFWIGEAEHRRATLAKIAKLAESGAKHHKPPFDETPCCKRYEQIQQMAVAL